MVKKKGLYNYKKALAIPFMIQKLWRGLTLENPVELTKVLVFGSTVLLLLTIFQPVMWLLGLVKGLKFAGYVLIPAGVVMLWSRTEPDGIKIPVYITDYLVYIAGFKWQRRVIYQNKRRVDLKELVVFEKI